MWRSVGGSGNAGCGGARRDLRELSGRFRRGCHAPASRRKRLSWKDKSSKVGTRPCGCHAPVCAGIFKPCLVGIEKTWAKVGQGTSSVTRRPLFPSPLDSEGRRRFLGQGVTRRSGQRRGRREILGARHGTAAVVASRAGFGDGPGISPARDAVRAPAPAAPGAGAAASLVARGEGPAGADRGGGTLRGSGPVPGDRRPQACASFAAAGAGHGRGDGVGHDRGGGAGPSPVAPGGGGRDGDRAGLAPPGTPESSPEPRGSGETV